MIILRKFILILFIEIFVTLPIVIESRSYQGYDFYTQFYKSRNNVEQSRYQDRIVTESHYNRGVAREIKYIGDDSKHENSEDNIVFPNYELQPRAGETNTQVRIDAVPICKGQTFCENISNYPEEFVNQALAKDSSLIHYTTTDVMDNIISNRMDNTDEQSLCVSSERLIRPKSGENINKEWLFIVQSNESNFTQAVRIEICGEEGSSCRIIDGFAEGYITMCQQKFIYRQLSAISKQGEIVRDFFRFPASCCCHIQFSDEFDPLDD